MAGSHIYPKIVHLVPCDGIGGVETAARSAAEATNLRCNLTLFFMAGSTLADDRSRIVDHPRRNLNSPATYWSAVRDLLALDPDVLVCSLWRSMFVGIIVKALRPRIRVAQFFHFPMATHQLDRLAQSGASRVADELWADSQATGRAYAERLSRPVRTISFTVGKRQRNRELSVGPRFVTWARIHPQKGHDRAIELIGHLVSMGLNAELDIWGNDSGSLASLQRSISLGNLDDRVRFRGPVSQNQLDAIVRDKCFYLSLSRMEGFGMSVVEVMQMGLIPIATPVGEIRHYLKDGENGLLAEPEDLRALANRIAALLRSPRSIEQMSKAASETWEKAPLYRDDFCKASRELAQR